MNQSKLHLDAPWDEVKEKIKEAKVELTDDDLVYEPGDEDGLLDRLSRKVKMSREETKAWIESISANKGKAS